MNNDEFNSYNITNEKDSFKKEFFKTQKEEFSSFKENELKVKSELNKTDINNDNVEDQGKIKQNNELKTVKKTGDVVKNISSTTHSVVATAAVISTAVISTVVGINVITQTKATAEMTSFFSYSDQIFYCLEIDGGEDDEEFIISLDNNNYHSTREAFMGPNEGAFEGLKVNEFYTFSCRENKENGKIIYSELVKTTPYSEILNFYINENANFEEGYFECYLEVEDEEGRFSDFVLNMVTTDFQEQPLNYSFTLNKDKYPNIVHVEQDFNFEFEYNYTLNYKDNGEDKVFTTGTVTFVDNQDNLGPNVEVSFDETLNYLTNELKVNLNFVDGNQNEVTNIVMKISDASNPQISETHNLESISGEQYIQLEEDDNGFPVINYLNNDVVIEINCDYQGVNYNLYSNSLKLENNHIFEFNSFESDYNVGYNDSMLVFKATGRDDGDLFTSQTLELTASDDSVVSVETYGLLDEYQTVDLKDCVTKGMIGKELTLKYYGNVYNFATRDYESTLLFEDTVVLTKEESSKVYGINMGSPYIDSNNKISFEVILIDDTLKFNSFEFVILTHTNTEYTYNLNVYDAMMSYVRNSTQELDLSTFTNAGFTLQALLEELHEPCDIYLRYSDNAGGTQDLLCVDDYQFVIS